METSEKNILGTEKISKLIKKFSVPCIVSLLVSSLYNIVDQIFIGQGVRIYWKCSNKCSLSINSNLTCFFFNDR